VQTAVAVGYGKQVSVLTSAPVLKCFVVLRRAGGMICLWLCVWSVEGRVSCDYLAGPAPASAMC
jgi:hypothetical protein